MKQMEQVPVAVGDLDESLWNLKVIIIFISYLKHHLKWKSVGDWQHQRHVS